MAGSGASGDTAAQIAAVLHVASPQAFAAVGQLQAALAAEQLAAARGDPEAPTLEVANGLFVQQGYALEPAFLQGLQKNFGAAPQSVDFQERGAVEAINAWVSRHTQGIIPRILSSLPAQTRLALANAIYLKAAWRNPFKPAATATSAFHGERASSSIAFMHETDELPYGRGRGYAAVDLPYRSSTLSLLVLLPVGQSLAALEGGLAPGRLATIVRGLSSRPVLLSLPRFHLATHTILNGTLEALGMSDAFAEGADFSRITHGARLKIGLVGHAADFKVDEAGTVAAAATVVTIEPTVAHAFGSPPVPFDADRPFLFFLRDDRSGALLFAGRLVDPESARLPA
jgi:serpin B